MSSMYESCDCFKFDDFKIHGSRFNWEKSVIFGQLVSVARLFAQFHASTKNFFRTFGSLALLKWSIKFTLISGMT